MQKVEASVLPKFTRLVQTVALITTLSGCPATPAPPSDAPLIRVALCHDRVWNAAWSVDDACTQCVAQNSDCTALSDDQCRERCVTCLGERACDFPAENLQIAAGHLDKSRTRPNEFWAFQGPGSSEIDVSEQLYRLAFMDGGSDRHVAVHNDDGLLWSMPFDGVGSECFLLHTDEAWAYRVCDGRVELYEAHSGFRLTDFPLNRAKDELNLVGRSTGVKLDAEGQIWMVATGDGVGLYDPTGQRTDFHEGATTAFALGRSFRERAVLFNDRVEYHRPDAVPEQVSLGPNWNPGTVDFDTRIIVSGADVFDLQTRQVTNVGTARYEGPALGGLVHNDPTRGILPLYPMTDAWPALPSDISIRVRGARRVAHRLRGGLEFSLLADRSEMPDLSVRATLTSEGYDTPSQRHGAIAWTSPTLEGDAVWIGSLDGLVKRWDFATGTSLRAEIPPSFAAQGRAGANSSLVLVESNWDPDKSYWARSPRVMVLAGETQQIVTFEKDVREAALPAPDVLVAVFEDETVWWSLSEQRITRREQGPGNLSADGRAIAFYLRNDSFFALWKFSPARVMPSVGTGEFTTPHEAPACTFNVTSTQVTCYELNDDAGPKANVYDVASGKLLGTTATNNEAYHGAMSPDGGRIVLRTAQKPWQTSLVRATGEPLETPPNQELLTFLPDGRLLAKDGEWLRVLDLP